MIGTVAVTCLSVAVFAVAVSRPRPPAAGAGSAPPLDLTSLGGGPAHGFDLPSLGEPTTKVSLSQFRGRPLVVNFWASWCHPCRQEMPALQAAYHSANGRVAFVGINTHDARSPAGAFLAKTGVTYSSGFDPRGTTGAAYGAIGLPTTVFVSSSGQILARHTGGYSKAQLERELAQLFPGHG